MKKPGTATVLIYNVFGKLMFEKLFNTSLSNAKIPSAGDPPYSLTEPQTFPKGIYILMVTVNSEKHYRKFIKLDK